MNLYAYCLSGERTPLAPDLAGVAGARPRLMEHEGITVVVSEFDGESAAVSRENVFAHERVIDHVLAQTTPLPFRFGTVASRARLESYVSSQRGCLQQMLARTRGCVEMGVKIIWNVEAVKGAQSAEDTARSAEDAEMRNVDAASRETGGPGTAFLAAKRREIMGDEVLKQRGDEVAAWLATRLGGAARESVVRVRPAEALMVAAAYLVERARLEEYYKRLEGARAERGDLHFLASGPWPPYSFSNLPSASAPHQGVLP